MDERLVCLIDWLRATLKTTDLNQAYRLLGIEESEFKDMPTGLYGYKKQKACGNIRIMYEGKPDMGIHIEMSGQGCREFETFHNGDWHRFLVDLWNCGANFSRIDLAIDDIRYNGEPPYFKVRQLIRKAKRGEVLTKWKSGRRIEKFRFSDGKSEGDTLYCGSPQSMLQLRFYEKDKERIAEGKELEEGLTAWNRVEFEMRDDRAQMAVEWICRGIPVGELIFGILSHYINFVDRVKDENKARWPVSKFWTDFLNNAQKLRLARAAPDKTIETKYAWIDRQVKPTLAEIWYAFGSPGSEFFVDMINEGLQRMTDVQWARAEEFRRRLLQEKEEDAEKQKLRVVQYLERREQEIMEYRLQIAAEKEREPLGNWLN